MQLRATEGNVVIEIVSEAMTSAGGLILAGTSQKLIVSSIGGTSGVNVGDEVEIQPHQFRKVLLDDCTYLLGPIAGIQAVIIND